MFNARTWYWLCVSAYIMFPGVIISWLLPEDSVFLFISFLMIAWGVVIAILGGAQGILFAFGRLKMGCPICGISSKVVGGSQNGLSLKCQSCGNLRLSVGRIFGLKIEKINE
jgi:hypothetical protein